MEKYKLNRSLAIIIVYVVILVLLFAFIIGVWYSLRTQLVNFVDNMPNLIASLNQQLLKLEDNEFLSALIPADANPASTLTDYLNKGFTLLTNYVSGLFSFVSNFAIILFTFPIMLFYMLKEGGKFGRKIVSFFPKKYREEGTTMMTEIDSALSGFIVLGAC